jgi:NAD-dependent dihydropyrimidine dehydrogenase PreA subunit
LVSHPEFCYHCYLCVKECPAEAIWLRTPMAMMVPYK